MQRNGTAWKAKTGEGKAWRRKDMLRKGKARIDNEMAMPGYAMDRRRFVGKRNDMQRQ